MQDNRATLKSNVDKLSSVSQEIVDHQKALAEVSDLGPAALNNLANIYNGSSETLDTRANLNELSQPFPALVCQFLQSQLDGRRTRSCRPIPVTCSATACQKSCHGLGGALPNPLAPPGTQGGLQAQGAQTPGPAAEPAARHAAVVDGRTRRRRCRTRWPRPAGAAAVRTGEPGS